MTPTMPQSETTIPVLPCVSLDETLEFSQSLGFEITYKMTCTWRRGGATSSSTSASRPRAWTRPRRTAAAAS
ncbi:hypothetical protein ACIBHY_46305 [Nonomuraea sp. NPDC050547]|uniref:hypothetical protein n=1 Tax=unclassified Nonomuraea TaxID=2593643 RepID=UPI00378B0008